MYIDLLRDKLREQESIYKSYKKNECDIVCYNGCRHETWGMRDVNYTNRLRLAYYLLYEKIDDEEVVVSLFEEELKDRENNSFQGIGDTIQILTHLLRKYNTKNQYDSLFTRAKNANFDCACGYDVNVEIEDTIESNDLYECIYLAQNMDYKDIMEKLVAEWKKSVSDWNEHNRKDLIRFNHFLDKEEENEELYKKILAEVNKEKAYDVASAYSDVIGYYIEIELYKTAYQYLNELLTQYNLEEIKMIRLYFALLEYGLDIMSHEETLREVLWTWIKPEIQNRKNMYGNFYKKVIAAAKLVQDPDAEQLEDEYANWKREVGMD